MAAPTFATSGQSTTSVGGTRATSLAATKPSGATDDSQILVASVAGAHSSGTPTIPGVPTGWNLATAVNSVNSSHVGVHGIYWALKADIGNGPYTWTLGSSFAISIGITTWDGAHRTDPIPSGEIAKSAFGNTVNSVTAPSITTAGVDRVIVRVYCAFHTLTSTWSPVAGYTERYDFGATISSFSNQAWDDKVQASSGSQGTQAASVSNFVTPDAYSFAIQAAPPASLLIPTQTPQRILTLR